MWSVYLRTSFATSDGVLMPSRQPTAPARFEGVRALRDEIECLLDRVQAVGTGNDDRLRRPATRGRERLRQAHRVGDVTRARRGDPDRGGGEELPAGQDVGHRAPPMRKQG